MFTVGSLRAQLARYDDDVPIGVCVITRSGVFHDRTWSSGDTLDVTLDDDGDVRVVWLTGAHEPVSPPPALQRVRCSCGANLLVDEHDEWPDDHFDH